MQQLYAGSWSTKEELDLSRQHATPAPEELRSALRTAAGDTSLPRTARQRLDAELEEGVEDAEVASLLLIVRNLQLLNCSAGYHASRSLVFTVLQHAPLNQLAEVEVANSDTEGTISADDLVAVLRLPALETFRGHMIDLNAESSGAVTQVHSPLKRIYLDWSLLDAAGLDRLLIACPELETFSMRWGSAIVGTSGIEYARIGQALRSHASKLKNLRLKPEEAEVFDRNLDRASPLGSLKGLVALRLLAVTYGSLCGATPETAPNYLTWILPHSLRTLRIADAEVEEPSEASDDEGEDENENEDEDGTETVSLDVQLLEVMRDENFAELSTIRVQRGGGFTLSKEAEDLGWTDEGGKFWIVLKKQRQEREGAAA